MDYNFTGSEIIKAAGVGNINERIKELKNERMMVSLRDAIQICGCNCYINQ